MSQSPVVGAFSRLVNLGRSRARPFPVAIPCSRGLQSVFGCLIWLVLNVRCVAIPCSRGLQSVYNMKIVDDRTEEQKSQSPVVGAFSRLQPLTYRGLTTTTSQSPVVGAFSRFLFILFYGLMLAITSQSPVVGAFSRLISCGLSGGFPGRMSQSPVVGAFSRLMATTYVAQPYAAGRNPL